METIAVIFGGRSAEHDVSIVTALASVIKPLELTRKYRVEAIYVAKDGSWYWDEKLKDIRLFTSGRIDNFLRRTQPVSVRFDGGMTLVGAGKFAGRGHTRKVDIVFPAMHGTYGEDGSLMGLLDMTGVPYVGCGLAASVLAMDKMLAKVTASAAGIATAKFLSFTRDDVSGDLAGVVRECQGKLKLPLFIKPAHLGSSIGITKANDMTELQNGLEVAAHYDDTIIVEEAVANLIEVTLPIMGNHALRPALLEKPLTQAEDFFDFETKYMQGGKKGKGKGGNKGAQGYSQIPADLPKALYAQAEQVGLAVYRALGCSGIARVDMLIDSKTSKVYFNEVNPLPGGLYVHNWKRSGMSSIEVVEELISLAKERAAERASLITAFTTNYLKQF